MAKKVQIDGLFTKQQCIEFIEDIANTEGNTLIDVQVIPSGNGIYDAIVIYENGVTTLETKAATLAKKTVKKGVE